MKRPYTHAHKVGRGRRVRQRRQRAKGRRAAQLQGVRLLGCGRLVARDLAQQKDAALVPGDAHKIDCEGAARCEVVDKGNAVHFQQLAARQSHDGVLAAAKTDKDGALSRSADASRRGGAAHGATAGPADAAYRHRGCKSGWRARRSRRETRPGLPRDEAAPRSVASARCGSLLRRRPWPAECGKAAEALRERSELPGRHVQKGRARACRPRERGEPQGKRHLRCLRAGAPLRVSNTLSLLYK